MHIYVDADAMPIAIREILYRVAVRRKLNLTLVSNTPIKYPESEVISAIVVASGPDEADHRIVELVNAGDLVITADIPLSSRVIEKNATVIDPRGEMLNSGNIGERLAMRNFMEELRNSGIETGGPSHFSLRDRHAFANQLDRFLSKYIT